MNAQSLSTFAQAAARGRAKLFPTQLLFRGEPLKVPCPTCDPSFVLEGGGYREGAVVRFRFPGTLQPPPRAKEEIQHPAIGQKYFVTTCKPAPDDCPNAHEHIVEARVA